MGLRVLVAGGAGFIGSHLCERLLLDGNEVLCLDNFFTGRRQNVYHLMDSRRFEIVRHDIVQPIWLEVDRIYNLACPASPIHYQHNPVKTVKSNILGAIHVLGMAKRVGARVLQASTSEVYGDPTEHPQREDYWGHVNFTGPRSCYDEGKRLAETLFFEYQRQHQMEIRVARIFNTYGPRMLVDDGRVVSSFVVQALRGEPLSLYGDGTQTRSFCFVDDLVEGLVKLMESQIPPMAVNLGNPEEISMLALARQIIGLTDSKSTLEFQQLPEDDPQRRRPDISRAHELLGWRPKVSLEEGLKSTISFFREAMALG